MPLDNLRLIVEPRYPYQGLNGAMFGDERPVDGFSQSVAEKAFEELDGERIYLINHWVCERTGEIIFVYHDGNHRSKLVRFRRPVPTRFNLALNTMSPVSTAWSIEAESKAMLSLQGMVTTQAFKCYFLTGQFLETSPRSGVTYLFRRLRPTVALRQDSQEDDIRILTTLCMHPIGYYEHSFAGCMVPTDDVIAHLTMMRGDERKFWSKANHHHPSVCESGI